MSGSCFFIVLHQASLPSSLLGRSFRRHFNPGNMHFFGLAFEVRLLVYEQLHPTTLEYPMSTKQRGLELLRVSRRSREDFGAGLRRLVNSANLTRLSSANIRVSSLDDSVLFLRLRVTLAIDPDTERLVNSRCFTDRRRDSSSTRRHALRRIEHIAFPNLVHNHRESKRYPSDSYLSFAYRSNRLPRLETHFTCEEIRIIMDLEVEYSWAPEAIPSISSFLTWKLR